MKLKQLILNNEHKILKDIIEKTGLTVIKSLEMRNYKEKNAYELEECELISNYIDNDLGFMSLHIYKVLPCFKILLDTYTNQLIVAGHISYQYINGDIVNHPLIDKDTHSNFTIFYNIKDNELTIKNESFNKGDYKFEVYSNDIKPIIKIKSNEYDIVWELNNILQDMIKNNISITNVILFKFNGEKFVEFSPYKDLKVFIDCLIEDIKEDKELYF